MQEKQDFIEKPFMPNELESNDVIDLSKCDDSSEDSDVEIIEGMSGVIDVVGEDANRLCTKLVIQTSKWRFN